jgi:hypothetical protein
MDGWDGQLSPSLKEIKGKANYLWTCTLPCVLLVFFVAQASWMSHKTRQMQHGVG